MTLKDESQIDRHFDFSEESFKIIDTGNQHNLKTSGDIKNVAAFRNHRLEKFD